LNSFGCMRNTKRVRVSIGVMDGHQHNGLGQKQR